MYIQIKYQFNSIFSFLLEPVVKVPNQHANLLPQVLPDPRHGFLYMYGPRGDKQMLKKLPFTIPELVANAPCRSSEGILYTGKKSDTWFILDPLTGTREHISGICLDFYFMVNSNIFVWRNAKYLGMLSSVHFGFLI